MKIVYKSYSPSDEIPVFDVVVHRKLVKYYTRETMAAVVAAYELLSGKEVLSDMPFFYASGETALVEFYTGACKTYSERNTHFATDRFIEDVVPTISPLSQFKMMRNMTHCFVAMEHGLKGDNAAMLHSVSGLLYSALLCGYKGPVLMGAGQLYADGAVECGFAQLLPAELEQHPLLGSLAEAITFFRPLK
ncbi:MAG: hypothetical protein AB7C90_00205 [Bacteroidales bacterium]